MKVLLTMSFVLLWSINTVAQTQDDRVLLQGFHWHSHQSENWWQIMESKAADIQKASFDMVWFPPSSAAASDEGYLPHELYKQDSKYGTKSDLQKTIKTFKKHGIESIADIVINHRVGTNDWADFTNPKWNPDAVCRDDEWPHAEGNWDSGHKYHAARDVDHSKKYVQESIQEWMMFLKTEIGYSGWRYDYTKGYSGSYIEIYDRGTQPSFSVGELWDYLDLGNPNKHRQQLCDWIDATKGMSSAFDFTTKGILQHAVQHREFWRLRDGQGKPVGLIGWWPEKAVTFVDNHDTGPSGDGGQNHWPFPSNEIMQGYAYILTHPGVPCVYWVHFFDWGLQKEIEQLIKIRKEQRIKSNSSVEILVADSSKYAAIIDQRVAMKIGPGSWSPGQGWKLATSRKNYAVWVLE